MNLIDNREPPERTPPQPNFTLNGLSTTESLWRDECYSYWWWYLRERVDGMKGMEDYEKLLRDLGAELVGENCIKRPIPQYIALLIYEHSKTKTWWV